MPPLSLTALLALLVLLALAADAEDFPEFLLERDADLEPDVPVVEAVAMESSFSTTTEQQPQHLPKKAAYFLNIFSLTQ